MSAIFHQVEVLEELIDERLTAHNGLLFSLINAENMLPFPKGFFDDKHVFNFPGQAYDDFSEWTSHENCGMVNGAYLSALVWRHRCLGDSASRAKADCVYAALRDLYDACQDVEEGYFCKPYGDRVTVETSSDQYLYVICALDSYHSLARPSDRKKISGMVVSMAKWWMRRNYSYPYFGKPLSWPLERFPVFAWLAYKYSGETAFRDEYERLCATDQVHEKVPFVQRWRQSLEYAATRKASFEYEEETGLRVVGHRAEGVGSGFLSISELCRADSIRRSLWLEKAEALFEVAEQAIGPDGLERGPMLLDPLTGSLGEVKEVIRPGNPEWRVLGFVGWIKSGMASAMAARALVGMHSYLGEKPCLMLAGRVLEKMGIQQMKWRIDVDGRQYPEDLKWASNVFSGDAATNWLWAYWERRARCGIT